MGSMTTNTSRVSKKEYFGYFCYGFGECFNYGLVGTALSRILCKLRIGCKTE